MRCIGIEPKAKAGLRIALDEPYHMASEKRTHFDVRTIEMENGDMFKVGTSNTSSLDIAKIVNRTSTFNCMIISSIGCVVWNTMATRLHIQT